MESDRNIQIGWPVTTDQDTRLSTRSTQQIALKVILSRNFHLSVLPYDYVFNRYFKKLNKKKLRMAKGINKMTISNVMLLLLHYYYKSDNDPCNLLDEIKFLERFTELIISTLTKKTSSHIQVIRRQQKAPCGSGS